MMTGIRRLMVLALLLGATVAPSSARASASDAWITTKAKMALLTTEGVSGTAIDVDTTYLDEEATLQRL